MKPITAIIDRLYRLMQRKYPRVLWIGNEARREITLTFDDGSHPLHTRPVLDTLKKYWVHASFFLLGHYAEKHPQIVKQIHADGHQIGIHGYRHIAFPLENPISLHDQLEQAHHHIAEISSTTPESINNLRPPHGAFTCKTLSLLEAWGYRIVMWNNTPQHWMQPPTCSIQQMLDQATPGGVIVLHDGHGHGTKLVQILEHVIPQLKVQGFDLVTIKQMHERKQ